jgi:hypothetical protein
MQPIERSVPIADGTLLEDPHGWIPGRSARFGKRRSRNSASSSDKLSRAKTRYTDARPILRASAISVGPMPSAFIFRT